MSSNNSIIVVHGCGVTNPGKDNEGLTIEGKMRVFGALQYLEQVSNDPTKDKPIIYMTGGLAQSNLGQKESEATHMKRYLESLVKRFFKDLPIVILEESESTDTFENITNVVAKTKESLISTLQGHINKDLTIYTSDYHTNRVSQVRRNTLQKQGIKSNLLHVLSSDKLKFTDQNIKTEYESIVKEYQEMRSKRPFLEKIKGASTEFIGSIFSYLGMDGFLSKVHEKIFQRKKK